MTITVWPANAVSGSPTYAGRALRQTTTAPFVAGATAARPLGARSGVRPGTSTSSVTASTTVWSVAPLAGVIDGEAANEAGPYTFASDAVVTGSMTAANASNPRVDIVYVQVSDPAESDGSTTPGVSIAYLAGSPASTPSAPATPARSFVLAQINVPKSGGGSPSVSWVAPFMVAAGGIIPVDTLANLRAMTGTQGQSAAVYADTQPINNGEYRWNPITSRWDTVSIPALLMNWGTTGSPSYGPVSGYQPVFQAGQASGITSGTGVLTATFGSAFPNGITGVILMPHQASGYAAGVLPVLVEASLSKTSFQTVWGNKASSQVYLPYIAVGY